VAEPVEVAEPVALSTDPKQLWVVFASAALSGGKSAEQAQADATDLILAHADLFPKDG
jgi:hypothetical protein